MKFGRAHRILTTALAAFGILALVGSVPLPGLAPVQVVVELLIAAQVVALASRRGAAHDAVVFALVLVHVLAAAMFGGGALFVFGLAGLALALPAALVLSHLRREVEGNYHQGARDRTGLPVDVPRILRSRRVMERSALVALGSVSVPLLGATAVLFLVLPRLGVSPRASWLSGFALDPRQGLVHFTDGVDLGQRGELTLDPSVALRFRVATPNESPPSRMPLRFRGATLDSFDGRVWTRTRDDVPSVRAPDLAPADARAGLLAITIEREPFDPPVTFVPSGTVAIALLDEPSPGSPSLRYVASVAKGPDEAREIITPAERAHHLALPAGMPSRVRVLAHAWADAEPTPEAKARAIELHLKKELAYGLASSSRGAEQPVDHFLFESKRGHCELFASAMAVMLRELGIPSRNVTGLVGGTYNRFGGYYAVRQGEAHDWVEAYIDGPKPGWRTFDPTPTAAPAALDTGVLASSRDLGDAFARRWSRTVVSYDRRAQSSIVDALRLPSAFLIGLAVALLLALGVRRGVSRHATGRTQRGGSEASATSSGATALYVSLEAALIDKGVVRDRSRPPLAHAEHLLEQRHPLADDVIALTRLYLETRFGGRPLSTDARHEFERRLLRVRAWTPAV